MFKFLFIFLLLILLFSLIALRYRKEITFLIKLLRFLSSSFKRRDSDDLVCCATCKKWVASSQALSMGMGNFYCSRECVNRLSRHE